MENTASLQGDPLLVNKLSLNNLVYQTNPNITLKEIRFKSITDKAVKNNNLIK